MKHRLIAISLLLLTATSVVAQGPPRGGAGGRAGFKIPDPVLFNGPPPPEEFLDLVSLDSTQYTAYRVQYVAFMDQTRFQRDSLLEFRRQMRERFESGEMSGGGMGAGGRGPRGGGEGEKIQKTLGEMEKHQKAFDETLKTVINESQFKRYEAWRRDELTRAEREMRERFGSGPR
jgi:hypothetical protein